MAGLATAFAQPSAEPPPRITDLAPTVIIVSFDGFRPDYLERRPTANFKAVAAQGVRAEGLIPIFPTKTFPNHYSMVTGLYAPRHGIVGNSFLAPDVPGQFEMKGRDPALDPKFWLGTPIWKSIQDRGGNAASMFWVGADAAIQGWNPKLFRPYNGNLSNPERVEQLLQWLDLPKKDRPTFLTLYFNDTDNEGHSWGPNSPQVDAAIDRVDSMLGALDAGLATRGIRDQVTLLLVSDHGMAELSPERVAYLDDFLPADSVEPYKGDIVLHLWLKQGWTAARVAAHTQERIKKAGKPVHFEVFEKSKIPERWHYKTGPRVGDLLVVADEGWYVATHEQMKTYRLIKGGHGYDNRFASMRGIFIARGPKIRQGKRIKPFESVHVYSVICQLTRSCEKGVDADPRIVREVFR